MIFKNFPNDPLMTLLYYFKGHSDKGLNEFECEILTGHLSEKIKKLILRDLLPKGLLK